MQEGLAYGASVLPAYPGDKHACMALIYAQPTAGVSLAQMECLVRQQLDSLADAGPTDAEVERIKKVTALSSICWWTSKYMLTSWILMICPGGEAGCLPASEDSRAPVWLRDSREVAHGLQASKVELVDALRRNSAMAAALASYHTLTGSWRTILQESAQIETLQASDVRDVAARTFAPDNCFTGYVQKA